MTTREARMPASDPLTALASTLSSQFNALFAAEFEFVCRALRRLGVRTPDIKDVAQELFLTVHARLDDFDTDRAIRPWLVGFAVRFASNYRKLARNRYETPDSGSSLTEPSSPNFEARDLLLRALDTLDFDKRTVIVLHDFEGFDAPEIARELRIPVNTVYSRIRLGREELRASVAALQPRGIA
jgi:RNA polymerase sigma-70 factor, ECF subfamily